MRRHQTGLTTVEFAIIGALLIVVLFAIIEFGRALFVMNTLTEATRRGARVATVCPVNDPAAARAAVFDGGGGASSIINGLTTANIAIDYLDAAGAVIADPAAGFAAIRYTRARIVNFTYPLIIPFILPSIQMPAFATTLPRESLGIPRQGVVQAC
jgi:Flp pilus assembly protein TadG